MSQAVGILVAAGTSTRFGGTTPKQFLELGGETVVARAVRALASCDGLDGVIVVLAPDVVVGPRAAAIGELPGVRAVVAGGPSRMLSALAGVEASDAEIVLVHDAARPFASRELVSAVLDATRRHGAAVPAVAARDTVKRADAHGFVAETVDRASLRLAQTPQGARRDWLLAALRAAAAEGIDVTDEAQALERVGRRVALVDGEPGNVKLTTVSDWSAMSRSHGGGGTALRIGTGFDIHRFEPGRALVLGGVTFPGETGLAGHSDADVVLHAAMDAVLGAAGLGDLGGHFPPGDPRFEGADSSQLARRIATLAGEHGWRIVNLDLTVLAERPKILARAEAMRSAIGACLGVPPDCVSVKATTLEGLGALGRAEGIACQAVVLLERGDSSR